MRTLLAALLLSLAAGPAAAQDAEARRAIQGHLSPGDRVTVTLRDGAAMRGRLVALDDRLVVRHGTDQREFSFDQIDRITRRQNGLLLGPLIGTAAGVAVGLPLRTRLNNEGENGDAALTVSIVSGVAIGTLLDALMGSDRTVYRRANTGRATIAIVPTRTGVAATWTKAW